MNELLSAPELAGLLRVPVSWVYSAARTERIPCIRLGKYVRFNYPSVLETLSKTKKHARRKDITTGVQARIFPAVSKTSRQ